MKVEGIFTINCSRCGKSYDFTSEEVQFLPQGPVDEQTYVWEKKYNCVKCGNPIHIRYEISFATDGSINDKNVEVDGAKVISDSFEFEI